MYFVYILFSLKDRRLYIGFTSNLKKRLLEHTQGEVRSTQNRRPLKLVYYEAYHDRVDAQRREKYLKGGNGRASLKIQLQTCFSTLGYRYIK
ncbi:MAG: GIY-YIG nuclease family protein [Patescibacteria group bacterium]